jgi:hypothetical protein
MSPNVFNHSLSSKVLPDHSVFTPWIFITILFTEAIFFLASNPYIDDNTQHKTGKQQIPY